VTQGRYARFRTEAPDYEQFAAWGPQIGNPDPAGAAVLSDDADRLGLETNEAGWVLGWVMECFERGILTREDTGGLEMNWGNVDAARDMLRRIAKREGIGDLLAEGVKRASELLGRGSDECAIYTMKGNTPRGHDHRGAWMELVDTCLSDTGTIEVGHTWKPEEQGAKRNPNHFDWKDIAEQLGKHNGRMMFEDSLGICRFTSRVSLDPLAKAVEAATGWEGFTREEAMTIGRRICNVLRAFNLRCGLTPDLERPSRRYGSVPVDGPLVGRDIMEHWDNIRREYYQVMGWDLDSGRPLPDTLVALGLQDLARDLW
jgi:aldehyde:ferredoxin oxidoreductase